MLAVSEGTQIVLGILGLLGILGGAAITGWFGLRAVTQRQVAESNTAKAVVVEAESATALVLLRDCLAENAGLRREVEQLRSPKRRR